MFPREIQVQYNMSFPKVVSAIDTQNLRSTGGTRKSIVSRCRILIRGSSEFIFYIISDPTNLSFELFLNRFCDLYM